MQPTTRNKLSWLVVVLGSFLGLLSLVIFGMGGGRSDQSGEVAHFFARAGMALLGLCFIVGSIIALRRRRLAGIIFLACTPFMAFCMTYPNAGYLIWRSDGGWFSSPYPGTAAFLTFLFFAPLAVLFFTLHRRNLLKYLFPTSACLAWVAFGTNYWARALLPGLIGWSIFVMLFALFWLITDRQGWPPLLDAGPNLGRVTKYVVLVGASMGLVFWPDGRATIIAALLLWLVAFPGEPRRRKRINAAIAMGIFLAIALAVKVDAFVVRHRAARLLADVKSLELRKTTLAEALPMLHSWPELKTAPDCGVKDCRFTISFMDTLSSKSWEQLMKKIPVDRGPWPFLQWAAGFFGYRGADVSAGIDIQRGVVWGESFHVRLHSPTAVDREVSGVVYTVSHFYQVRKAARDGLILQTSIHPEYILGRFEGYPNYDTVPIPYISEMSATITPYADPAAIHRLAEFNLSCITNWLPCRYATELMPEAWTEHQKDQPRLRAAAERLKCTPEMVMTQAGNAPAAAVVEVVGNRTDSFGSIEHAATEFRLVKNLRGGMCKKVGGQDRFWVSPWMLADDSARSSLALPEGKQFILLYTSDMWMCPQPTVWPYPCGVILWSEENLALVQRGIAEDPRANDPVP